MLVRNNAVPIAQFIEAIYDLLSVKARNQFPQAYN